MPFTIQENVPLSPLTTLKVGGPARYFAEAQSVEHVVEALSFADKRGLPLFVLGGGSNLVISDAGWPGLVLKISLMGINHRHLPGHDHVIFEAAAGEDWDEFVAATVTHHCAGIECLSGIPGTVGGTPIQNVGAYGQEVSEVIEAVTAVDRESGKCEEFSKRDCGFAYRSSIFNTSKRGRYIVVRADYRLAIKGSPHVAYADLKNYFAAADHAPTLQEVRDAVREIRGRKGMVINADDPDSRSAGSFFKNPILSNARFEHLEDEATARNLKIPAYPSGEAARKVSAAWLVENSGFKRGFSEGRVGISTKHSLAIVSRPGATATEVVDFQQKIRNGVNETWGIELEPEPMFVGFQKQP